MLVVPVSEVGVMISSQSLEAQGRIIVHMPNTKGVAAKTMNPL